MKKILFVTILNLIAFNTFAQDRLDGEWYDKSEPNAHIYEFKKGQEFIYTENSTFQSQPKNSKSIGVWEVGNWGITRANKDTDTCNLRVYAATRECCFEYKFIAKNLVLTLKQTNDGHKYGMCDYRVLVKKN